MKARTSQRPDSPTCRQARYQIRVCGYLDPCWAEWFSGVTITHDPSGETILEGLVDQAMLHGLLARVRDLGLILLSVTQERKNHA
jgi:hypothetical protein